MPNFDYAYIFRRLHEAGFSVTPVLRKKVWEFGEKKPNIGIHKWPDQTMFMWAKNRAEEMSPAPLGYQESPGTVPTCRLHIFEPYFKEHRIQWMWRLRRFSHRQFTPRPARSKIRITHLRIQPINALAHRVAPVMPLEVGGG